MPFQIGFIFARLKKIPFLPKAFGQLKKLEWLNLASNSLNVMDDNALGNLHSLLHLNMAHNRFVALPSDLFHEAKYLQVFTTSISILLNHILNTYLFFCNI